MNKLVVLAMVGCSGAAPTTKVVAPVDEPRPDPVVKPVEPPPPVRAWPASRTESVTDELHGKTITDPYRWLEDEQVTEVQAWMTAQDTYARAELAKLPNRDDYAARLAKLMYYDASYAPVHRKGRMFFVRKLATSEKTMVLWRERGVEKVLLDPNTWSADGTTGLGGWWADKTGRYVAYQVKLNNSDESTTHVIATATGKQLPDKLEGTKYGAVSWRGTAGFYYTWVPPLGGDVTVADRPGLASLRYHELGKPQSADREIFPPTKNPKWFLNGGISDDGTYEWARISRGWTSSDLFFRKTGQTKWTTLVDGADAIFDLSIERDTFYIRTNDGAPRYRVFKVEARKAADRKAWREIVPESDATLQNVKLVGGKLALTYLRNASTELVLHDLEGKLVRKIDLPGIGSSGGLAGYADEDTAYFSFSSFASPMTVFETSIKTGVTKEWSKVQLPIEAEKIVTEQVWFPSKDGTKISMFVVYRVGTLRDGKAPLLLSGYGGFNISIVPSFSPTTALFVERGGVYATPNLRGGGEYGEAWHRAGMLLAKQNVFDDFIGAAEYLIANKWTTRDKLAISGGSNGGLLVGAVLAQRPDLFKAVICSVPLLDMLRYHKYGSGKTWIEEYGSADDPAQFAALHAYSPYRIVIDGKPARYPAVLFDSADHDDRVDPMHARKLAAAVQARQTGDAPVLLRIERNAGHGGADLVKAKVARAVDHLVFLDSHLK